jgi:hypothetical protein
MFFNAVTAADRRSGVWNHFLRPHPTLSSSNHSTAASAAFISIPQHHSCSPPDLAMQAMQHVAGLLVVQLRDAASPQQLASAALALVDLCEKQRWQSEWQDAAGMAEVPASLVRAAKIGDAAFQRSIVRAFGHLVKDHEENQSAAAAAGAIPLLLHLANTRDATLQRYAVRALRDLVKGHKENQSAAAASGAIPFVVQLAKARDALFQVIMHAVEALSAIVSDHEENQDAAAAAGAIPVVMRLAKSSDADLQRYAVRALRDLVYYHEENQDAAAAAGAIPVVVQLAKSSDADLQSYAVDALGSLVGGHEENQDAAAAAGAIPVVVQLAKSSDAKLQRYAVDALGSLVSGHEENQYAAAAAGAIPVVVQLAKSSDAKLQRYAVDALRALVSGHEENKDAAAAAGAIPVVVQLAKSGDAELQGDAVDALRALVSGHEENQCAAAAYQLNLHTCIDLAFNNFLIGNRVSLSLDADGNPLSPMEQRTQIKRPLKLVQAEELVRRSSGNKSHWQQSLPPLGSILAEYSPILPVRFMFGCVATACQRLATAPGSMRVTVRTTWCWAEWVRDRVMRGHVSKVQVRLQRRACCGLRCALACRLCLRSRGLCCVFNARCRKR